MTAITASDERDLFSTLWDLVDAALGALGRGEIGQDDTKVGPQPLLEKLAGLRVTLTPIDSAANRTELLQRLGEVGLSPAFAEAELELSESGSPAPPSLTPAVRASVVAGLTPRLGRPTAEAFVVAMDRWLGVLREAHQGVGLTALTQSIRHLDPVQVSLTRRRLVLGDVVAPWVSEELLANFRGQAAVLALVCALDPRTNLPEWRGLALADIALAGADAFRRLIVSGDEHIDLDAEASRYQATKDELLQRLLSDLDAP